MWTGSLANRANEVQATGFWPGDPRVNIQNDRGMAKAYQVRQSELLRNCTMTSDHYNIPGYVVR